MTESAEHLRAWLEERLGPDEAALVWHALQHDGRSEAGVHDAIERLLGTAADFGLAQVPPLVAQDLRQIASRGLPALWQASLIADSRLDRPLAGVRGSLKHSPASLTYGFEVGHVVLSLTGVDLFRVEGQVLLDDEDLVFRVSLERAGSVFRTVSDHLGRFEFNDLQAGLYSAKLSAGTVVVELAVDLAAGPTS